VPGPVKLMPSTLTVLSAAAARSISQVGEFRLKAGYRHAAACTGPSDQRQQPE